MAGLAPTPVDQAVEVQGVWAGKAAWGSKAQSSADSNLKEGQEECNICFVSAVDVKFVPCKHGACTACVDQLRAAAVFKPDAGVKCPYCRQFVNGYSSLTGEFSSLANLREANKAAKAAAAAREAGSQQKAVHDARQPTTSASHEGPPSTWMCVDCGRVNHNHAPKCTRCKKAAPRQNSGKDVLQCNSEELVFLACRKYHPDLNAAFREIGLQYNSQEARLEGSHEDVVAALQARRPKRLIHVVNTLSAHGKVWYLVTHLIGNYCVQDLLQATKMLRLAAQHPAIQKLKLDAKSLTGTINGQDVFAQLQRPMIDRGSELLQHPQGFFVLDKALQLSSGAEAFPFAQVLLDKHGNILLDKWFLRLVSKVIDRLVETALEGVPQSARGADLLDVFCERCCARQTQVAHSANFFQPGQMMVEAIQGAMPRPHAVQLAGILAGNALKLAGTKRGAGTIQSLMLLRPFDGNSKEAIITVICLVAQAMELSISDVVVRVDLDGHRLIQTLVEQLAQVQENAWVFSIASELVQGVQQFCSKPLIMSVLAFTLAQPAFEEAQMELLLQELQHSLGWQRTQHLVTSANEIRSKQHAASPAILLPTQRAEAGLEEQQPPPPAPAPPEPPLHQVQLPQSLGLSNGHPQALPQSMSGSTAAPAPEVAQSAPGSQLPEDKEDSKPAAAASKARTEGLPPTWLNRDLHAFFSANPGASDPPAATQHAAPISVSVQPQDAGTPAPQNSNLPVSSPTLSAPSPAHPDPSMFFPPPAQTAARPAGPAFSMASFLPHMLGSTNTGTAVPQASRTLPNAAPSLPPAPAPPPRQAVAYAPVNGWSSSDIAGPPAKGRLSHSWTCNTCTYEHTGSEAEYLICAMCAEPRDTLNSDIVAA